MEPPAATTTTSATATVRRASDGPTDATARTTLEHIRTQRKELDRLDGLLEQQKRSLIAQYAELRNKRDALQRQCTHPRQERRREYGMYDGTEHYCPDCGRSDYV